MPAHDQHAWLNLLDPLQNDLERFAYENLGFEPNIGKLLGDRLSTLDVLLAEPQESLVDNVVVKLLLLLELEDLGRLLGEYILDVVEDGVMVLDVERTANV